MSLEAHSSSECSSLPRPLLYLLYHELTAEPTPYGYAYTALDFRDHLQVTSDAALASGFFKPEISFDDGHVSNWTLAMPELERVQKKAHFFITAGWTSKRADYMTVPQLRQMHDCGHSIGAHGWSHRLLTHCSSAELQIELVQARQILEDTLGASVSTVSLPGGRYNERVLAACREAGYQRVFTSVPQESAEQDLLPGRVNLRAGISPDALRQWLDPASGALRRLTRQYQIKQTGKWILGDSLYAKLWSVLNRSSASAVAEQEPL